MQRISGMTALSLICLLGATAGSRPATADPAPSTRSPHGRISEVEGKLLVRGPDDEDWSYIQRNGVVYDDDMLWADDDSLAEIEMERGAWLRLGPDTRVDVRRLPPAGDLGLRRGSVAVDLSDGAGEGVVIRSTAGTVTVFPGSLARVDLDANDRARVLVRRGRVLAEPLNGSSKRASAGEMLLMWPDSSTVRVAAIDKREFDEFDDWCDDRVAYYLDRGLPKDMDRYLPGSYQLVDYGDWVDNDGDRYWRPRGVASDWRPYSSGNWGYWRGQPLWVASEPWGYTTSHYGRWLWTGRFGWVWKPGYTWGPAWVSWGNCGEYVGWAPLDPWGRPCYRNQPVNVGGLFVDALVWSVMPRPSFCRIGPGWRPGPILACGRAPRFQINQFTVINNVTNIYRDVPREHRFRGLRQIDGSTLVAGDRFRQIERRNPRADFRIASLGQTRNGGRPPVVGAPDNRVGGAIRDETRARVRRQLTVPGVSVIARGRPQEGVSGENANARKDENARERPGGIVGTPGTGRDRSGDEPNTTPGRGRVTTPGRDPGTDDRATAPRRDPGDSGRVTVPGRDPRDEGRPTEPRRGTDDPGKVTTPRRDPREDGRTPAPGKDPRDGDRVTTPRPDPRDEGRSTTPRREPGDSGRVTVSRSRSSR